MEGQSANFSDSTTGKQLTLTKVEGAFRQHTLSATLHRTNMSVKQHAATFFQIVPFESGQSHYTTRFFFTSRLSQLSEFTITILSPKQNASQSLILNDPTNNTQRTVTIKYSITTKKRQPDELFLWMLQTILSRVINHIMNIVILQHALLVTAF